MDDCIFCKITSGDIPAAVVYQDEYTFAFMTIESINPGHLLVIPKKHIPHVDEMNADEFLQIMDVVKKMMDGVKRAFSPPKVGMMVAGWEVPHAHIHVVPMTEASDVTSKKLIEGQGIKPTEQQRIEQARKIADALS